VSHALLRDHDVHGDGHDHVHNDIVYPSTIPFILVHLACFGVLWSGVTALSVWLAVGLYLVRMWAITAGFHRYFSHRSYKTSRFFQFVLAFLGQMSAQRGVIWWAAVHRHHHLLSDTPEDVHSPRHMGFFQSHVGWIFRPSKSNADYSTVKDLTKYPELVFLDKYPHIPPFLLAIACFLIGGWPGLFVGFFCSTVVLYHCVFFINSLAHVVGTQRYMTADDSRNNWWLALLTFGEGWHNNHHHYPASVRQGFYWWEVDISYYILRALSWVGLVWDLRSPPEAVVENKRPVGRKALERVAHELASTFPAEQIAAQVRGTWESRPRLQELTARAQAILDEAPTRDELSERLHELRREAAERLQEVQLPHLPTREELKARANEMYADSPSMDEVAERARELLAEAISVHVLEHALARR